MMNKNLGTTALATLAALLSSAAMAAPVTFDVDNSHTFSRISYSHLGLSTQLSRFDKTSGTIVLDQEAKEGQVHIDIDTRSISTGNEAFNQHIQGPDFLDTATFPNATFSSTKINFDGDTPVSVEGDLTIKGVTKPATFTITHFARKEHPMLKKDTIGADAETTINRSDFNAGKFSPGVGENVTISVSLEAFAK